MSDGQSHIKGWSHVVFCVADADVSAAFYRDVLGFEMLFDMILEGPELEAVSGLSGARGRVVAVQLGDSRVELVEYRHPKSTRRSEPANPSIGFVNIALEVDDVDSIAAGIKRRGIPYDAEPQAIKGVRLFFIRDPDGNRVEFVQYPGAADRQA